MQQRLPAALPRPLAQARLHGSRPARKDRGVLVDVSVHVRRWFHVSVCGIRPQHTERKLSFIVELSEPELRLAVHHGTFIVTESVRIGLVNDRNQPRSLTQLLAHNVQATVSEMSLAKELGIYYPFRVNNFHTYCDVGRFDVRSIGHEDDPRGKSRGLIVRSNDHKHRAFVLGLVWVGTTYARTKFLGWAYGHEVAVDEHIKRREGRTDFWSMPQGKLRSMKQFKEFGGSH